MKTHILISASILSSASLAHAAVSFTGTAINDTFNGFDGNAAPTGWDASGFSSGAGFSELRGSSTGGESTGGTYAFDIGGGDVALGVQPGGSDFTPGYYQLEVTNDSGAALTGIRLGYDGFYLNDQARGNTIELSYSTDGTSFTPVAGSVFESPEVADSSPVWIDAISFTGDIAVTVPDGGSLYLRFDGDDSTGGGSRDEFAIDNVSFDAIPEPSSALLGSIALLGLLRRRR